MYQTTNIAELTRTKIPKAERMQKALEDPTLIVREMNNRSLFEFIKYFWPEVSNDPFLPNWHISLLCDELEEIAYRVANRQIKKHDLIINIPPGTTKTITCSIMFPAWCWTKWHWLRFITASYSGDLSLESAEYSRDLIRSERFRKIYPDIDIKEDKDTKGNFRVVKKLWYEGVNEPQLLLGGNRFSTSVGAKLTGFHGHILIVDDPIDPTRAISETERATANRWVDQTLSTRKTDKSVSTIITVMQRIHQDDPSGHLLAKKKENLRHICLPGEIRNYKEQVQPPELVDRYVDDLLDPIRMPWTVLDDLRADLGQYGFSGQVGQKPTPPGGGMFQVRNFQIIERMPPLISVVKMVRYWDKAGSEGAGAFTVGLKMALLKTGIFVVMDIKRGQWGTDTRESIIRKTAEADGSDVTVYVEQEPGSGGKESAEATIKNLAGFSCYADRPTGDKALRADPYSVQVNNGNVWLLRGDWNHEYMQELENFPNSTYKDQVDASSGAFNHLATKKIVRSL